MTINLYKVNETEDSATVRIHSLVQQKILSGIKIVNFSAGEPQLLPHQKIIQAVTEAMIKGKTLYPPVTGIAELRGVASDWMNESYNCSYTPENCLVVNGGKFGIYLLLQHILEKDDEVIIASPYWVSYPAIVKLFGGIPILVETQASDEWKLALENLIHSCSAKTRVLIINNASNPTGSLYSEQELTAILHFAKENNLIVISDEVYSGLVYNDHSYISCGSFEAYQDHVVVIQSCSKNFSMTGFRVGFFFGNRNIIRQLTSLISQSTSGVTTLSQWAAVAALQHANEINSWVRTEMQKRRDILIELLNANFGITVNPPKSSLYIFISLSDLGVKNVTSSAFCNEILENVNVAMVPGSAFGKEGYVRLSFGTNEEDLELGVKILAQYLREKYE